MLIGREKEIQYFKDILKSDHSHFIALFGRRRIGKTFLVKESYNSHFCFQNSGLANASYKEQLQHFSSSLKDYGLEINKTPKNWLEAFDNLKTLINKSNDNKKIIFLDELSWMDTPKSDMLTALEGFWNGYASFRDDIILIVCASATSWILKKIIHNKGGLYNRLTYQINLQPFTLKECEEFVNKNGYVFNRMQILQLYMIFGGVPYYWTLLEKGKGVEQNIDSIFFKENAILKNEYKYLYASIYKNPVVHMKIIEALATKKIGMSRDEIIKTTGLINSGDISIKLEELEECGFIRKYNSFGMKKKYAVYQLIDFFTFFYFSFIKNNDNNDENYFSNQINSPKANTWLGLSFERVCLSHINQIKQKLGISGISSQANSWYCQKDIDDNLKGSQIDLLIVRKDYIINLCEMKYSIYQYRISEKLDSDIKRKIADLLVVTKNKYAIHPILVTTNGLLESSYNNDIQVVVTLNDLFG